MDGRARLELARGIERLAVGDEGLRRAMGGFGLGKIRDGDRATYSSGGAHAHVWFDAGVASDDYGRHVPDSGEWQVIVSTSPDPLNMRPRGRELARREFRYADPKMRNAVLRMAEEYVGDALARHAGVRWAVREALTPSSRRTAGTWRETLWRVMRQVEKTPGDEGRIARELGMKERDVMEALDRLARSGFATKGASGWVLTPQGERRVR